MVEVHTKSAMRRHNQIQMRMRKLRGLVAIFTCYTKEKRSLNVDCTREAARDRKTHESECQYCEQNNTEVSLEER